MPWKERYTISDEKSLADSEIDWPDGNRCCVSVTVDLSDTAAETPPAIIARLRQLLGRYRSFLVAVLFLGIATVLTYEPDAPLSEELLGGGVHVLDAAP